MNRMLNRTRARIWPLAVLLAIAAVCAGRASAQPRHEYYHTPHWVFDDRYHHNHYYPAVGYSITVLPPGYVQLRFHGEPFYFHAGVWYRAAGPGFVVVAPPPGIVVPALPPAYSTVVVAGVPYYYANSVYYVQRPDGYSVVEAPPGVAAGPAMGGGAPPAPGPQVAAPAAPPQTAGVGMWYFCESAKAYYPYVNECKEGWRQVPAAPPPAR
ncbi:MAG TPA: DUF6515 family protein [Burkholderiales bacterium]|nr:DUF6515 family protein [Burkholderiales bacterium]